MNQEVRQEIREPIKVIASFEPRKIRIHFFGWRDRIYKVQSMNLFHLAKDGDKRYYHFAVSAAGNSYLLAFDPVTLNWQLKNVVQG